MNKIQFIKQLDAWVGRALVSLLPKAERGVYDKLQKILFIRPGGIGDAVLLIPALQAIKEKCPDTVIHVLAETRNAAIFAMCPAVNKVLLYDRGGLIAAFRNKYDVVIDTEQWHRLSAVCTRLMRSQVTIGFGTNERKKLFTDVVDYCHEEYELNVFFDLLRPLGIKRPENIVTPFLKLPAPEKEAAHQWLNSSAKGPYVVLFPGASISERHWGSEKFKQLALGLVEYGCSIVVIGGRKDYVAGETIALGCNGLNMAGKTSLIGSAAIIEKSALLVSGDSGMLHIGVALAKPTVSLFGSGIAAKWAPRGKLHRVLNKKLPCSPCTRFGSTPPCPINTQCLREIQVEEVLTASISLLKSLL
jgi:lipopolysaccharide heptosyltransferase II